jgi:hypothetical protein
MKPILRNLRTGLYFQGGVSWTEKAAAALVYKDVEAALDAAYSSGIPGLELNILLFHDIRFALSWMKSSAKWTQPTFLIFSLRMMFGTTVLKLTLV